MAQLRTSLCTLRPWHRSDEQALVDGLDNRAVWAQIRDFAPHPYRHADAVEWIKRCEGARPTTQFAVVVDGVAVGGIGLLSGSGVYSRQAEMGYWLGESFWGRGIMSAAALAVAEYAFGALGVHRLAAACYASNAASAHILRRKLGMVLEGCRRQACYKDGRFQDELVFGLLASEWAARPHAKEGNQISITWS